jgi:hypothetical protein
MAHNYTNTASKAALDAPLNSSASSFAVSSFTGYPAAPFYILVDRDTSSAELMEVTGVAGTTLTVVRGAGGTASTSHSSGADVEHVIPAAVPQSVEQHVEATSNVHGVTGALVGADSTGTLANKTFRGAHTHTYSDTLPDSPAAAFLVNADNSVARDGFAVNNTGANADRNAFVLRQSGSDRVNIFNDGTIKVTPAGSASRPSIESTGNIKAENFESTDDITAAGDITAIGNVEAAAGNFGNLNVSASMSSTGDNTVGTLTAAGLIRGNQAGTGLTIVNNAEVGSLNVTNGNAVLSGTNARLQFPASPTSGLAGTATGQVRYRSGAVETWDGTRWRVPYQSGGTEKGTGAGLTTSTPTIIWVKTVNDSTSPYRVLVSGSAEFNSVPNDGTRWDLVIRLDNATSGTILSTGVGNGFVHAPIAFSDVLNGSHTIYWTAVRTLGGGSMTLTSFNQFYTGAVFGTVD